MNLTDLLAGLEAHDPDDPTTWRCHGRPLTARERALVRAATADEWADALRTQEDTTK